MRWVTSLHWLPEDSEPPWPSHTSLALGRVVRVSTFLVTQSKDATAARRRNRRSRFELVCSPECACYASRTGATLSVVAEPVLWH